MSWFTRKIAVTFIDDSTNETIGVAELTPDKLPETFENLDTTMNLQGDEWSVVSASPTTRKQYSAAKRLTLRLHRILKIDPSKILFSLASICDAIPGLGTTPVSEGDYQLADDDWRQVEFVERKLAAAADEEIEGIRRIHDEAKVGIGFREIHVRKTPEPPIVSSLALADVVQLLEDATGPAGVTYRGCSTRIVDGFAFALPEGPVLYGLAPAGRVRVLALDWESIGKYDMRSVERLKDLACRYELDLVDWCRCCRASWDDPLFSSVLAGKGGNR
ncbi:MAG: hypothetical protein U0836_12070 [Pirellulales bacterium]